MVSHGGFIAYYRVSTGKQGKSGLGIEAQRQAVATYLNGGNWRIVAEFTEVRAASVPTAQRWKRRWQQLAFGRCRLSWPRSTGSRALSPSCRGCSEAGVDVRFADLPMIEGATGKFLLQQMAAVAELEAGMISARTKAALAAAKRRGVKLGGDRGARLTRKPARPVRLPCGRKRAVGLWT